MNAIYNKKTNTLKLLDIPEENKLYAGATLWCYPEKPDPIKWEDGQHLQFNEDFILFHRCNKCKYQLRIILQEEIAPPLKCHYCNESGCFELMVIPISYKERLPVEQLKHFGEWLTDNMQRYFFNIHDRQWHSHLAAEKQLIAIMQGEIPEGNPVPVLPFEAIIADYRLFLSQQNKENEKTS